MAKYFDTISDSEFNKAIASIEKNPYTGLEVAPGRLDYAFEVWSKNNWQGIVVPGGQLTAYGEEKTLKSTFLGIMMIAFLKRDGIYQDMKCNIDPNKMGMWADGEITRTRLFKYQNQYMEAAGFSKPPKNYKLLDLKKFSDYKVKAATMIKYIYEYKWDLGFLVLDGFVDLISGLNDEIEAKELESEIAAAREEYGFVFATLIHQNRKDGRTSGSAGSVLDKRSDYLIKLTRKDIYSNAVVSTHRNGTPEHFDPFEINFIDDKPSFIY